jgi:hypothetical protein
MVNYNMYAFNRKSINMIHTTIYIIYQSILINNVNVVGGGGVVGCVVTSLHSVYMFPL